MRESRNSRKCADYKEERARLIEEVKTVGIKKDNIEELAEW